VTTRALESKRILVVEDEMIVAMEMSEVLRGAGCEVIGPVNTVDAALQSTRDDALDAVVLDVSLNGVLTFAVASTLAARGIPFILATGYSDSTLPAEWRASPRVSKPFRMEELIELLQAALRQ
jgi:chemotaxis family two-component system sensor kinase Cph1